MNEWHLTSDEPMPLGIDGLIVRTKYGERTLRWTSVGYYDSRPEDIEALVSPERGNTVKVDAWRLPE